MLSDYGDLRQPEPGLDARVLTAAREVVSSGILTESAELTTLRHLAQIQRDTITANNTVIAQLQSIRASYEQIIADLKSRLAAYETAFRAIGARR